MKYILRHIVKKRPLTSFKMNIGTHNSIFHAVIKVSRDTGELPLTLLKKIIDHLPKKDEGFEGIWDKDDEITSDVSQWRDAFKVEMQSRSENMHLHKVREFLEFCLSNVRIFYDTSLHKHFLYEKCPIDMSLDEIIDMKDAFIETEIERLKERMMSMEKKVRSRESETGKITMHQTAPDFWVNQFNEEVDAEEGIARETSTPPPPNWLRIQRKKEKMAKLTRWRNMVRPSVSNDYWDRRWSAPPRPHVRSHQYNDRTSLMHYDQRDHEGSTQSTPPSPPDHPSPEENIGESILQEIQEERQEGNGEYFITERSAKGSLKEMQTIIDEDVKDKITEGVYILLMSKMKEVFDYSK